MSAVSPFPGAPAHPAHIVAEPPGRVEATHVADRAFAVFVRGHELTVDQPVEASGDNDGPTPVELFVAALTSCVASDAVRFLQLLNQPHQHLRVRTDFTLADTFAPRIKAVHIHVQPPAPLSQVVREGLHAVIGRCAIHNTLHNPPEITVEFG